MGHVDSVRYPLLQEMIANYWHPDGQQEPLDEVIERAKADAPDEIPALRAEIGDFLKLHDDDLDEAFVSEFVSYYWPRGGGQSAREWLSQIDEILSRPLDVSRDFSSGYVEGG